MPCGGQRESRIGEHAGPLAEHLVAVMLDEARTVIDRANAAVGLQVLRTFFPSVTVPSGGPNTSMPAPDVPGTMSSEIMPFAGLSASEEVVAGEALALVEELVAARARHLPDEGSRLIIIELAAALQAKSCRYAQEIATGHAADGLVDSDLGVAQRVELDAHQARRQMEELILDRSRELLRERDLGLN